MEYTTLGKTGLRVSRMGFGGIPIQKVDASVTRKLMERLAERGVNYIDTARGYTVSESFLGEALEGGLREKFVLATKSMSRTKEAMAQDIETSLHNLRTDYIDLYQIHNPSLAELEQVTAPGGALEALLEAKASGRIGHIGVTAHMASVFEKALTMDWVETVMFPYNIVETQGEALMQRCREQNVGFICMKPMAGGALEVYTVAAGMKKSRPGTILCVLCHEDAKEKMVRTIFRNTTTIGVREHRCSRYTLKRSFETVQTPYGDVQKKLSSGYGVTREKYEYEDLARIAREQGLSLAEVRKSI